MILNLPFAIWLSLVLTGLGVYEELSSVPLVCCMSPGKPVALVVADLLGGLQTVESSVGQTSWLSVALEGLEPMESLKGETS